MENSIYRKSWEEGIDYSAYRSMIDRLLAEGKTTGTDQSEKMIQYSELNVQRMKRIDKTTALDEEVVAALQPVASGIKVLVITEAWCGDAAQIVPVIAKLTEHLGIEMRIVLRDEYPDLIERHLTNGGKSIPVILTLDAETFEFRSSFGPRPSALQRMVLDYRALAEPKLPYSEFQKNVQLWYAKDKQRSIQKEWSEAVLKGQSIGAYTRQLLHLYGPLGN